MSDFLEARLDAREEASCGLCSGDVEAMLRVVVVCGCGWVGVSKSGNSAVVVVVVQGRQAGRQSVSQSSKCKTATGILLLLFLLVFVWLITGECDELLVMGGKDGKRDKLDAEVWLFLWVGGEETAGVWHSGV